jgi:hypothetical protein
MDEKNARLPVEVGGRQPFTSRRAYRFDLRAPDAIIILPVEERRPCVFRFFSREGNSRVLAEVPRQRAAAWAREAIGDAEESAWEARRQAIRDSCLNPLVHRENPYYGNPVRPF